VTARHGAPPAVEAMTIDTAPLMTIFLHHSRFAYLDRRAFLHYLTIDDDVVMPDGSRGWICDVLSPTKAVVGWYGQDCESTHNVLGWTVEH